MLARDCMTTPVATVRPEQPARAAAEIMLKLGVSGVPVVDAQGLPLGVVSEVDFQFGDAEHRQSQRETWLNLISGGQPVLARDYVEALEREADSVGQIMNKPAICVDEQATLLEVAAVMSAHRIKRAPVLREGRVVGVITRADLLRFFAPPATPRPMPKLRLVEPAAVKPQPAKTAPEAAKPAAKPDAVAEANGVIPAAALKALVAAHENNKAAERRQAEQLGKEKREAEVKDLLQAPFTEAELSHLLLRAREAATRGETACPALVFPALLCEDGGRMVNLPDPAWPSSLRGKAADFFARWDAQLRPLGFQLGARIVTFPDGFPGEVELSLVWGS